MDKQRQTELAEIARKIRVGIVEAVHSASSGHPGGSLSIADILTYLYSTIIYTSLFYSPVKTFGPGLVFVGNSSKTDLIYL